MPGILCIPQVSSPLTHSQSPTNLLCSLQSSNISSPGVSLLPPPVDLFYCLFLYLAPNTTHTCCVVCVCVLVEVQCHCCVCLLAVGGASSAASGSGGGENNGECEWVTCDCPLWRDGEWEDHPTTTVPLRTWLHSPQRPMVYIYLSPTLLCNVSRER